MQRDFCTKYRPGKELSLDESMCPFKGRVHFKCYNPKKPNRFHIKLFMVSELSTGYICGFEVYTGEASGQSRVMCRKYRMHQKLHALSYVC